MNIIDEGQRQEFAENGVLILRKFYDLDTDIRPIQRHIYEIVGLVMRRHGILIARESFAYSNFDSGFNEVIAIDRAFGAEVYDAVKQIPAFIRLVSGRRSEQLFSELRNTDLPGIGAASYGIRIDNPNEEQYRSHWHQEFLFQPQSMDGVVLWTPLISLTQEMGPVIVCMKSHKDGLCKYIKGGAYSTKPGAYQIGIANAEEIAGRYAHISALCEPGDLLLMDFLTIHQSGFNVSNRSRWTIQTRFFNFREPTGIRIGWKASVTAGTDIEAIFPEHFVENLP